MAASRITYLSATTATYRISLLAHREHWGTDHQPLFEILDHEEMITYWVEEVPTPQHALQLLKEHGQPPEEWDLP